MESEIIISWLRDNAADPLHLTTKAYTEGKTLLLAAKVKIPMLHYIKRLPMNSCKCRLLYNQVRLLAKRSLLALAQNQSSEGGRVSSSTWSELNIDRVQWELLPHSLKSDYFYKGKLYSSAFAAFRSLAGFNLGRDNRDLSEEDVKTNASLAKTILTSFDEIERIWSEIDYYLIHNLPMPGSGGTLVSHLSLPGISELTDIDLVNRLKTRRSNICTYRNRLAIENGQDTIRANHLEKKMVSYQSEVRAIEDEIRRRGL